MKTLLALLFLCSLISAAQPNIVLMLVDDMGVMDTSVPFLTGADGKPERHELNRYYRTPQMERLAARGIRLNQFCAMSVCSPTRIALLTGQNAARHHSTNWINPNQNNAGPQGPSQWNWQGLTKSSVTLPALLRDAGYRTIHVGKGHFGPRGSEGEFPENLGFQVNVAGCSIGAPASYYGTESFGHKLQTKGKAKGRGKDSAVPGLEKYHGQDIFLTEALTLEAKAHMSAAVAEKKPFFLYFPQYAVHGPHQSDPRYAAHYKDSGKSQAAQNFATLIEGMDKSLGDVLDHLDALGVAKDTLVLFLGDNGSDAPLGHEHAVACAAPLRGKKGSHYEGGTRVPFIAAWAAAQAEHPAQKQLPIPAGTVQTQQAAVMDVFPTLLTLAGVKVPEGHTVDGHSLHTLLSGKADPSREETFLMHYPHSPHRTDYFSVLRAGEWKVMYHYFPSEKVSGGSHYQLYHLKADPFEQNDLSQQQPAELKRMMHLLVAELEKHAAQYPEKDGVPQKPVLP